MEPAINETTTPKNYKTVSVTPKAAYAIQGVTLEDWRNLFEFIRLNLRSRMMSLDERDLIKLQGKLECADEIEKLFMSIAKMPVK